MGRLVLRAVMSALATIGALALLMPVLSEPLDHGTLALVFAMNALALVLYDGFFLWRARRRG